MNLEICICILLLNLHHALVRNSLRTLVINLTLFWHTSPSLLIDFDANPLFSRLLGNLGDLADVFYIFVSLLVP